MIAYKGLKQRPSKHNSVSSKCRQGHIHKSRGEAEHCNLVEARRKCGDIESYEVEKRFDFIVNGIKICSHYPDFFITGKDGSQWVEEYKGFASPVWPIKQKLFKACFPDIPYKVVRHK